MDLDAIYKLTWMRVFGRRRRGILPPRADEAGAGPGQTDFRHSRVTPSRKRRNADKPDAPSGTARELAEALGEVAQNQPAVPVERTHGSREARGACIAGTQVHWVRLPGIVLAFETIFGLPDERLTIRHDAGKGAEPYVNGTLLAVRRVMQVTGLVRGLDRLLFGP
jgi:hypothetical protein